MLLKKLPFIFIFVLKLTDQKYFFPSFNLFLGGNKNRTSLTRNYSTSSTALQPKMVLMVYSYAKVHLAFDLALDLMLKYTIILSLARMLKHNNTLAIDLK